MNSIRQTQPKQGIDGHRLSFCRLAALIVAGVTLSVPSLAEASAPTESEVKAAYLYNFGRFVEWPARARAAKGESFKICVLGEVPFRAVLYKTVGGETIDGKPVVVKSLSAVQEAGDCHILFIGSSERGELKEILAAADGTAALTVSDMPEFTRRGGMIQFLLENNRVRFQINVAAAEHAGLALSSQLLRVAVRVQESSQPGD